MQNEVRTIFFTVVAVLCVFVLFFYLFFCGIWIYFLQIYFYQCLIKRTSTRFKSTQYLLEWKQSPHLQNTKKCAPVSHNINCQSHSRFPAYQTHFSTECCKIPSTFVCSCMPIAFTVNHSSFSLLPSSPYYWLITVMSSLSSKVLVEGLQTWKLGSCLHIRESLFAGHCSTFCVVL